MFKWLDCRPCNHKIMGSNLTKLMADFTMTRISIFFHRGPVVRLQDLQSQGLGFESDQANR